MASRPLWSAGIKSERADQDAGEKIALILHCTIDRLEELSNYGWSFGGLDRPQNPRDPSGGRFAVGGRSRPAREPVADSVLAADPDIERGGSHSADGLSLPSTRAPA